MPAAPRLSLLPTNRAQLIEGPASAVALEPRTRRVRTPNQEAPPVRVNNRLTGEMGQGGFALLGAGARMYWNCARTSRRAGSRLVCASWPLEHADHGDPPGEWCPTHQLGFDT